MARSPNGVAVDVPPRMPRRETRTAESSKSTPAASIHKSCPLSASTFSYLNTTGILCTVYNISRTSLLRLVEHDRFSRPIVHNHLQLSDVRSVHVVPEAEAVHGTLLERRQVQVRVQTGRLARCFDVCERAWKSREIKGDTQNIKL